MPSLDMEHFLLNEISDTHRSLLLKLATETIFTGVNEGLKNEIDAKEYDKALQQEKACFVSLSINDSLRGCIGSLEAQHPLVNAVVDAAHSAAFLDPRFPPVSLEEFYGLETSISVLSKPEIIQEHNEKKLLTLLRPGIDGLILEEGNQRGTFLPSVWEQLPEPTEFLKQLKRKAGLSSQYWSNSLRVSRYTTESFSANIL